MNRLAIGAAALVLSLVAACTDEPALPADLAPAPPPVLARLQCRVEVAAGTMQCGPTAPGAGEAAGDLIVGGQGVYVRLANGAITVSDGVLSTPVTVQNLTVQPIGTADGATRSPRGVRVFFTDDPTNGVEVANPDGTATYTAAQQPYFQYGTILHPGRTTAPKTWSFTLNGAESFTFWVLVAAEVPRESGILRVTPVAGAIVPNLFSVWSSQTGDTVVAAGTGVVIRSTDGGVSWRFLPGMEGVNGGTLWGTGKTLLVAAGGALLRSPDMGATWTWRACGVCDSILELAGIGDSILAVQQRERDSSDPWLIRSLNGGVTWATAGLPEPRWRQDDGEFVYDRAWQKVWTNGRVWIATGLAVHYRFDENWYTGADGCWTYYEDDERYEQCEPYRDVAQQGDVVAALGGYGGWAWSPDGGHEWQVMRPGPGAVAGLVALAALPDGLVAVGAEGRIARASGPGVPWSLVPSGTSRFLLDVAGGSRTVVAVGMTGTIRRSTNGGQTWTAPRIFADLNAVWRVGDTLVAVGGSGAVLRSTGGGAAWDAGSGAGARDLRGVWGAGSTVVAVGDMGVIYRSADGGATWAAVASGTDQDLQAVAGDGSTVLAVGRSGTVLRSTDAGATWPTIAQSGRPVFGVAIAGASAIAVGEFGSVRRSSDAGATWSLVPQPTTETFRAVWTNGALAVAVGTRGTIMRSTDGGMTWSSPDEVPTTVTLTAVTGVGEMVLAAGAGQLLQSFDGGMTWSVVRTGFPQHQLNGVWIVDEGLLGAVGERGLILRGTR